MNRLCRGVLVFLALAYVLALALFAIGASGLFGQERDPLSAVFLVPLGLPWNLFLDALPEASRLWLAAAAPIVNLLILWLLCRLSRPQGDRT